MTILFREFKLNRAPDPELQAEAEVELAVGAVKMETLVDDELTHPLENTSTWYVPDILTDTLVREGFSALLLYPKGPLQE